MTTTPPPSGAAAGPTIVLPTAQDLLRASSDQKAAALIAQRDNETAITTNEALIPGIEGEIAAALAIIGSKGTDVAKKRQDLEALKARILTQRAVAEAARKALREANTALKKIQKNVAAITARKTKVAATHSEKQTALETANAAYTQTEALHKTATESATPDQAEIKRLAALLKQQRRVQRRAQKDFDRAQARLALVTKNETDKKAIEAEKLAARDALVAPDAEARKETNRLYKQRTKDSKALKTAEDELKAEEDKKANAETRRAAARQAADEAIARRDALQADVDTADHDFNRYTEQLRQEAEAAERAAQEAQRAAQATPPAVDAARAEILAQISADAKANFGKADNFTEDQVVGIISILKRELDRPGTDWKDNFSFNVSDEGDKITFENRASGAAANAKPKKITVNPRLLHIHGKMDDHAIQAVLIVADQIWGKEGIQIKTMNPLLKSRILANAEHLRELGKIKAYKTRTLFGEIGEGFGRTKTKITAPRDSIRYGRVSYHRYRSNRIRNGLESNPRLSKAFMQSRFVSAIRRDRRAASAGPATATI